MRTQEKAGDAPKAGAGATAGLAGATGACTQEMAEAVVAVEFALAVEAVERLEIAGCERRMVFELEQLARGRWS